MFCRGHGARRVDIQSCYELIFLSEAGAWGLRLMLPLKEPVTTVMLCCLGQRSANL